MARLPPNLPRTATRSDYGLVQPQDLSLVTGVIETKVPSYGVPRAEPPTLKERPVNVRHIPRSSQRDIAHHVSDPFHV